MRHRNVVVVFAVALGGIAACTKDHDPSSLPGGTSTGVLAAGRGAASSVSSPASLATACDSTAAMCFRDTAYMRNDKDIDMLVVDADWIVFVAAQDSLELYASADRGHPQAAIITYFGNQSRQERDSKGNTAPFQHLRLASDGVVRVSLDLSTGESSVPYTLRVRHAEKNDPGVLHASGRSAKLAISSAQATERFSVIPTTLARSVHDVSAWTVLPGSYNVALLADSLYEVCGVPCTAPDTVKLTPGVRVVKRY